MQLLECNSNPNDIKHQWAIDAHTQALFAPWHEQEVQMQSDVQDWASLVDADRKIIAGILQGFVQTESNINDYWRKISDCCPDFAIQGMAAAFSAQEAVHFRAYAHLERTLGLDTYAAFVESKSAQERIQHFDSPISASLGADALAESAYNAMLDLCIFSGYGEGVSLYGSFAALLAYSLKGKMRGLAQIISWSCRDEELHSQSAIKLFHELNALGQPRPAEWQVHMEFELLLKADEQCIWEAFGDRTAEAHELVRFLRQRCNIKLNELGYSKLFEPSTCTNNIGDWFYPLVQGTVLHDFFALAKNGSAYSGSISQDFASCDYKSLLANKPQSKFTLAN